jgi:pyruvate,water dikinase
LPLRVRFIAARARTWQRRRERTRATLARYGTSARVLLLTVGQRLCDRTILQAPEEVFYLLREEILSLLEGSAPSEAAIAARIDRRRAHYRRMLTWPPPPRLLAELPDGRLAPYEVDPGGDALHGFGASPGRVTGRARVVRDLGEAGALKPGEILVTRTTDIGWTPLFRLAAAVVTEIGAPTSHAAIVARELGVPAVVNVGHVTDRVCSGDELFVDGWAGLVRRTVAGGDAGSPKPG